MMGYEYFTIQHFAGGEVGSFPKKVHLVLFGLSLFISVQYSLNKPLLIGQFFLTLKACQLGFNFFAEGVLDFGFDVFILKFMRKFLFPKKLKDILRYQLKISLIVETKSFNFLVYLFKASKFKLVFAQEF
jgi:hypothetical protein